MKRILFSVKEKVNFINKICQNSRGKSEISGKNLTTKIPRKCLIKNSKAKIKTGKIKMNGLNFSEETATSIHCFLSFL